MWSHFVHQVSFCQRTDWLQMFTLYSHLRQRLNSVGAKLGFELISLFIKLHIRTNDIKDYKTLVSNRLMGSQTVIDHQATGLPCTSPECQMLVLVHPSVMGNHRKVEAYPSSILFLHYLFPNIMENLLSMEVLS